MLVGLNDNISVISDNGSRPDDAASDLVCHGILRIDHALAMADGEKFAAAVIMGMEHSSAQRRLTRFSYEEFKDHIDAKSTILS